MSASCERLTALKFTKKGRRHLILPRKTPSSPSHPSPAYTINRIIHPHQGIPHCPPSAASSPAAPEMRWRGMEGFVVREPFEMRARGGVVALLLRDDGSTRTLACQEHQAFPDLAKPSMPRDKGRLGLDVIFNFTWSSVRGGRHFRGLVRTCPRVWACGNS